MICFKSQIVSRTFFSNPYLNFSPYPIKKYVFAEQLTDRRPSPPAPLSQQNTYIMNKRSKVPVVAVFVALFATAISAQRNILKITPLPILCKPAFQYERKIVGNSSVEVEWQHWDVRRKKGNNCFLRGLLYTSSSSEVIQVKGNRMVVLPSA